MKIGLIQIRFLLCSQLTARMFSTTLLILVLVFGIQSADLEQAVDIIPQNTSPIADPDVACQVDAVFTRIHQLAVECGAAMRARHDRDEHDYFNLVRSVGVLGDFNEISKGRYHWALDFVNYVERMVGHKKQVTNSIFSELEQRIGVSQTTENGLQQLHQQSVHVLNAILLKCRRQVTNTALAAIRYQEQIHLAALKDGQLECDVHRWQLVLEEDVLRVSENLREITEENLELGYRLLDQFDRIYRQTLANYYNQ